jgi:hypothetical protein
MEYLRVKNWENYQHYKDRSPPWIKLHRAVLDDYEFAALADESKAHLMLIWIFASQREGRVPADPAFLQSKIGARSLPDLGSLTAAGWLIPEPGATTESAAGAPDAPEPVRDAEQCASETLAPRKQGDSTTLARDAPARIARVAGARSAAFVFDSKSSVSKKSKVPRARTDGPSDAHRQLATELGVACDTEWQAFWDRVDAKGRAWFKDADAAFRNWLRNERKYAERDGRLPSAKEKRVAW